MREQEGREERGFFVERKLEVTMDGVKFGEKLLTVRDRLHDVAGGRKGMYCLCTNLLSFV